ncbi:MAG: FAD-dependent oxidoreductase, partial [Planctomycetota bacterium]
MQTVPLLDHTPETVVILGGGPAGISCALWLKNLGHNPIILESGSKVGGTPGQIGRPNRWIAGMPEITSLELAKKLQEQCTVSGLEVLTEVKVLSVSCAESHNFKVTYSTSDGTA